MARSRKRELRIGPGERNAPLARWLERAPLGLDPVAAAAALLQGRVFANGRRAQDPHLILGPGQRIVLHEGAPEESLALPVLHEDEHCLVVNKPPGIHVNETESSSVESVVLRLSDREAFVVHRLDRETSGVLLLAKGRPMAEVLSREFRERRVEKRYLAITRGRVAEGLLDAPLGPDRRRPRARMVRADGQAATTRVRTLAELDGYAAVSAEPLTGRTHQIRVHLAHAGAPILGDLLYGGDARARLGGSTFTPERVMLHARELRLTVLGRPLAVRAPLPQDFLALAGRGLAISEESA